MYSAAKQPYISNLKHAECYKHQYYHVMFKYISDNRYIYLLYINIYNRYIKLTLINWHDIDFTFSFMLKNKNMTSSSICNFEVGNVYNVNFLLFLCEWLLQCYIRILQLVFITSKNPWLGMAVIHYVTGFWFVIK